MSTSNINHDTVDGQEALTVGEKFMSFFKELSVGIDAFNAKNFNKSIHKVEGIQIWKNLSDKNVYFSVSTKHIPVPVFFNSDKISFKEYVEFVLKAVPILKLVDTQADIVYRGIKTVAATGKVPFSLGNVDNTIKINETRAQFTNVFEDTRTYTRAVNQVYKNFGEAYELMQNFNTIVGSLQSRDVELVSKRVDQVVNIVKILKAKTEANEIGLAEKETRLLNDTISNLVDNVTFAGKMINQLSEMTRVLQLQTDEARKLQ
ncbi:hypothetical protein PQD71_gp204 [Kosakonia phage Kc263]|uniref:Uncharacterized protein n=1 Tax=Kosakonia phage Kc263 TaxID=2863194 RepID=A0AAE8BGL3_9CAUD|nr:hypothetical protein PQD71_gp204 [Kosakonia phage Kc263]QYN80122.1 hypothetical protein [Kosakonia phage Kc263]